VHKIHNAAYASMQCCQ